MIAAMFDYFNKRAKGAHCGIADKDWKNRGFFEVMFDTHVCNTMRVYFREECVYLVWLKWMTDDDGRLYEVETPQCRCLVYRHFDTTRSVVLEEFLNVKTTNQSQPCSYNKGYWVVYK
jgi:hypothetical protein